MSLDPKLKRRLTDLLGVVEEREARGPRLVEDAQRVWGRVQKLVGMHLVAEPDMEALELACYALQLPMRQLKPSHPHKILRTNVKERAEQAAELLVTLAGDDIDEALLDRATRLLHEMLQRSPMIEDARLLADAINLEDFGVIGMVQQVLQLLRQGEGVQQLAAGCEKRDQYGYWEARQKDGFHFEPVRQMAKRRTEHLRQFARMLANELSADTP